MHNNPDTAAALANAVAASYIENTAHEQKASDAGRLTMLKEEQERITKELDDDRTEQAELNAQLGVAAIGPEAPEHYDSDIAQIHAELVKARSDHDEAAARLTSISSGSGPSSAALNAEADQLISTDPGLSSLKQALLTRRAALVSHMSGKTPDNPQYKQDQEELQKIDAALESETQDLRAKAAARIEEQLRADLDRTASLEARLNGELAQMTRAAASATPKLQRSSDLANDITRLQNRYNTVDEQLQNQTLEDSAPGTAHLAEAAVPPTHPAIAGVVRNALLLLFAFILFGLAAAVVAHKLDPHVYVASDVEQLLGYRPMAQLPDFDEVSDEVAEEHLLRLATAIEFASKDDHLTSCVFTGTGPGVGVTTIVTRVKEMLGLLGKEAVLMDAAGPVPAERLLGTELQRNPQGSALMPHTGEAAASDRQGLMLTDTAPLTVSAEAEYMARRADCTILVIESAKTTRAELRAAASSLQRLNPAAVGFVLNRVSLKNADESFRNSVSDVERHLHVQGRTAARTVAQSPRIVPEATHSSPVRKTPALAETAAAAAVIAAPAAPPTPQAAPQPLSQPAPVVAETRQSQPAPAAPAPLRQPTALAALRNIAPASFRFAERASQPAQDPAAKPVAAAVPQPALKPIAPLEPISALKPKEQPKPQSASWTETPPAQPPHEETLRWLTEPPPWWLGDAPKYADSAIAQPPAPRVGNWHSVAANGETAAAAEVREEEKAAGEIPTRLSGLRGILFSLGVKDLSPKKHAEPDGNGNGVPADATPSIPSKPWWKRHRFRSRNLNPLRLKSMPKSKPKRKIQLRAAPPRAGSRQSPNSYPRPSKRLTEARNLGGIPAITRPARTTSRFCQPNAGSTSAEREAREK